MVRTSSCGLENASSNLVHSTRYTSGRLLNFGVNMIISTRTGQIEIGDDVYRGIFEASIVSDHPYYLESIKARRITLSHLIDLCRQGRLSYALFFGSSKVVMPMIERESERLFNGFDGEYSIGVRGGRKIGLNAVRLLIKDIKLKQEAINRFIKTGNNPHVKYLKNSSRSLDDQAKCIVDRLGIDMDVYRAFAKKSDALQYIVSALEKNKIFISFENTGTNMPQNFKRAEGLTGVYIRHKKFPYFFVSNEGLASSDNLPARKVFTLMYLATCLFKGQSKMVSMQQSINEDPGDIYKIVELILTPAHLIPHLNDYSVDDLDDLSASLNVTPLALLVRLLHLEYIDHNRFIELKNELFKRYGAYKARLKREREEREKQFRPNIVNNIRIYQGKAFLRILRDQFIAGKIKRREINRQLSYGKGAVDIEKVFEKL